MLDGTEIIIQNIGMVKRRFDRAIKINVKKATEKVYKRTLKNCGLTCHSLERLAKMGHPYSVMNPNNPHSPVYLVHKQTGNLRNSIQRNTENFPNKSTGYISINEEQAHYASYVILGTSKMIPRDFLTGSLDEMRNQVFNIIRDGLKQVIIERVR